MSIGASDMLSDEETRLKNQRFYVRQKLRERRKKIQRKPKPGSLYTQLSDEAREDVIKWLLHDNQTYEIARQRLQEKYGIDTNLCSLGRFYTQYCYPALIQKRYDAAQKAAVLNKAIKESPADFYSAAMDALTRRAMDLSAAEGVDPRDASALLDTIIRHRKQMLEESKLDLMLRRIKILEAKLEAQEAAEKSRTQTSMNWERMRQIFQPSDNGNGTNHIEAPSVLELERGSITP